MHPQKSPDFFALFIDDLPYFLSNIHPENRYYNSDPIGFIVPEKYAFFSGDQEWYPEEPFSTAKFPFFTE